MAYWLVKTEPETYSYQNLADLGRDRWNGVRNFKALSYLRKMVPDDLVFIYHTGKQKAIVGVAKVVSQPYPDPTEEDKRFMVVDLVPLYLLKDPVTLKEIKATPEFAEWELVRLSRLSVMPVTDNYWSRIHAMSGTLL